MPSSRPTALSRRESMAWVAAGLATPWLPACGGSADTPPAPPAQDVPDAVRWCRDTILQTLARPGGKTRAISVALLAGDRVVWREAFGQADSDNGTAATPDMRVNIGSVSKVVTALAVMVLCDRGLLALDRPVAEVLPSFRMRSPGFARITVRHLLSHASGVPGTNLRNVSNFVAIEDYAQDTLYALSQSRLKHEPGEMAMYCNDGFTLVEPLVQQVSGLPFPDFVQREIFAPLGMSQSGYARAPLAEGSFIHPWESGHSLPQEMPAMYGTGGIVSTPTDMMKLARLLMDGGMHEGRRLVSAEAIREMGVNQALRTRINPCPDWSWGLGWDAVEPRALVAAGLKGWSKNGGTAFFSTEFFVLPEARLAMMVSGNGFDYESLQLAEGLLLRAAAERKTLAGMPAPIAVEVPAAVSPAPDTAPLLGIYANYDGPVQVSQAPDGTLTLRKWSAAGWTTLQAGLRARSDGRWWADGQTQACYDFQEVEGHRYVLARRLAPHQLYWADAPLGEWLAPLAASLPAAWQARVGSQWLWVNDSPDSVESRSGRTTHWHIGELAELPGYVLLNNEQLLRVLSDDEAGMAVKVPCNSGRDLFELQAVRQDGQDELHSGSLVFRRVSG